MNRKRSYYRHFFELPLCIYATCVLAYFLCSADDFLFSYDYVSISPGESIFLLVPLLAMVGLQEVLRRQPFSALFILLQSNAWALIAFFMIVACALVFALLPGAYWLDNGKWIKMPAFSFFVLLAGVCLTALEFYRRWFRAALAAGFAALFISLLVDMMLPGEIFVAKARAAGFAENANLAALSLVLICAGILRYDVAHRTSDLLFLGLTGLGTFVTLSRGGMLMYAVLCCFYLYTAVFKSKGGLRKIIVAMFSLLVLIGVFAVLVPIVIEQSEMFTKRGAQQRLSQLSGSKGLYSDRDSRLRAIAHSFALINDSPVLGHGTGHTRFMPVGPHNMYIQQWVNNGLPGATAYLGLLIICYWQFKKRRFPAGQAFILVTAVGSMFSHNILDHRFLLLMLGGMLGISCYAAQARRAAMPLLLVEEQEDEPMEPDAGLINVHPHGRRSRALHIA